MKNKKIIKFQTLCKTLWVTRYIPEKKRLKKRRCLCRLHRVYPRFKPVLSRWICERLNACSAVFFKRFSKKFKFEKRQKNAVLPHFL